MTTASFPSLDTSMGLRLAALEALMPDPLAPVLPATVDTSGVGSQGSAAKVAAALHVHPSRIQRVTRVTDANGQVSAVLVADSATGLIVAGQPIVTDPAGGVYACTTLSTSTAQAAGVWTTTIVIQVKKQRTLPAVIALLTTLVNYDTYQPAPAGLTVSLAAGPPTS